MNQNKCNLSFKWLFLISRTNEYQIKSNFIYLPDKNWKVAKAKSREKRLDKGPGDLNIHMAVVRK